MAQNAGEHGMIDKQASDFHEVSIGDSKIQQFFGGKSKKGILVTSCKNALRYTLFALLDSAPINVSPIYPVLFGA